MKRVWLVGALVGCAGVPPEVEVHLDMVAWPCRPIELVATVGHERVDVADLAVDFVVDDRAACLAVAPDPYGDAVCTVVLDAGVHDVAVEVHTPAGAAAVATGALEVRDDAAPTVLVGLPESSVGPVDLEMPAGSDDHLDVATASSGTTPGPRQDPMPTRGTGELPIAAAPGADPTDLTAAGRCGLWAAPSHGTW